MDREDVTSLSLSTQLQLCRDPIRSVIVLWLNNTTDRRGFFDRIDYFTGAVGQRPSDRWLASHLSIGERPIFARNVDQADANIGSVREAFGYSLVELFYIDVSIKSVTVLPRAVGGFLRPRTSGARDKPKRRRRIGIISPLLFNSKRPCRFNCDLRR
jgi:hypothetical protein